MLKLLVATSLAAACLAGCTSSSDSGSSGPGSSFGGFSRSTDTQGTNQRRMDTYGGTTAPVLPTIGNAAFGR